jgi:hypothetical protein
MSPPAGRRLVAAIAAMTLLVVACGGVEPRSGAEPGSKAPRSGHDKSSDSQNLAPDFSVKTFEGSTFRLSDHRGTPVVLNFWESW